MRFLFTTMQFVEAEFYGRVADRLAELGHESAHVVVSRRSASLLRRRGHRAWCLPELAAATEADLRAEGDRVLATYPVRSLRDVWWTDPACEGMDEAEAGARTVRLALALERVFDESRPDVVVPEVGTDTMRTLAHHIGRERGLPVLYLFYTIFPNPLRLYVDEYHRPIVPADEVRPLSDGERREVEAFIASYTARGKPTLAHRRATVSRSNLRDFARHVAVKAIWDRDNEYLHPLDFVRNTVVQRARAAALRPYYSEPRGKRPFVYFPLHLTNDFKVKRVIPHCADQEYVIGQVADALPEGWDLVLKEHPVSIGRNPLGLVHRLTRRENVRIVDPYTSSHDLIRDARAVAVISSTVGLEALLYAKPVLALGQPFYAGYGVTIDVEGFGELPAALSEVLDFAPDRERILAFLHAAMRACRPGAPMGADDSDENAATLARTLDQAGREAVASRRGEPSSAVTSAQ